MNLPFQGPAGLGSPGCRDTAPGSEVLVKQAAHSGARQAHGVVKILRVMQLNIDPDGIGETTGKQLGLLHRI